MKTRTGKIAQLPKSIRDQLNHRLQNGAQSPDLLKWLNDLPETKELLAAKFDNQPITISNLSHWRHGGFLDWLQDQQREQRIQRLAESNAIPGPGENPACLLANIVRFSLAELMADLDSLAKLRGQKRSQQLHHFIRNLARLQNSYNHTRRTDLAWTKYNGKHSGTGVRPLCPEEPETQNSKPETTLATLCTPTEVEPDHTESQEAAQPGYIRPQSKYRRHESVLTMVYHSQCYEHCICTQCHAAGSEYPLDEVLRDEKFYKEHQRHPHDQHGNHKFIQHGSCDCFCDHCAKKHPDNLPFGRDGIRPGAPLSEPERPQPFAGPEPCAQSLAPSNPVTTETIQPPQSTSSPSSPLSPLEQYKARREIALAAAHAHFVQKFGPRTSVP